MTASSGSAQSDSCVSKSHPVGGRVQLKSCHKYMYPVKLKKYLFEKISLPHLYNSIYKTFIM